MHLHVELYLILGAPTPNVNMVAVPNRVHILASRAVSMPGMEGIIMTWFGRFRDALNYRLQLHRVNSLPYAERGVNVQLFNGSIFQPPQRIRFGNDIYVGPDAEFYADGGITIHDNVIFSPRVTIYTSNHVVNGAEFLPYGPLTELGEVVVRSHVWIGAGAIVLAGVRIGEGAVIAAGSVVNRSIPPLAMVAGNPARVHRYRDPLHYMELKKEGRFFMKQKRDHTLETQWIERPHPARQIDHTGTAIAERERKRVASYDFDA